MTTTAKAMVHAFYGKNPAYSYFNGCSTGGRQGVMEAQRYPDAYDGILAGAPVINFPKMQTGQLWGQVVMLAEDNPVAACKFAAAVTAEVDACDTVGDGVRDGVIGDALACRFDLSTLIGQVTPCGTITAADVAVMEKIRQGPRRQNDDFLWYGLSPGAPWMTPTCPPSVVRVASCCCGTEKRTSECRFRAQWTTTTGSGRNSVLVGHSSSCGCSLPQGSATAAAAPGHS